MPATRAATDAIPGLREPIDLPEPANALESRLDRLTREVSESTAQLKELVRLAATELALPALNRRAFVREASRLCLMARRHKIPLALLYVNIDDFRQINEAYGRRGGDAVLEQLAQHLERLTRGSDLMGRVGADEFCGLLSHTGGPAAAGKIPPLAAPLRDEPPVYLGRTLHVHVTRSALHVGGRLIHPAADPAACALP